MTDILFSKIATHQANLKKNQTQIAYCNETFQKKIAMQNITANGTLALDGKLPAYKYFKNIKFEDIINLRANLDCTNTDHQFWCKKIHRFLEFRFSSVDERIKKNYVDKVERITFIQNVITLLLEYSEAANDKRYLSIAMKLLRKKSLAKQGLLNNMYNVQYSYNIIAAQHLIKNL